MSHHVIYLPGFGDQNQMNAEVQIKLIKRWQKYGLKPQFQRINWANNESFDSKLERILKTIDEFLEKNHKVSLIGVSAGATMAINVYSVRRQKINRVIFICGKINHPEKVGEHYFCKNPAFRKSLSMATNNLRKLNAHDKSKMLSIHPIFDETVYVNDAKLAGASNKTIFSILHVPSIILALSLYKKVTINFLNLKV